jgi:hypothetical protein
MSKLSEMSTQRVGIVESGYDHLQLALAMIWLKIWRLTTTIHSLTHVVDIAEILLT